MTEEKGEMRRRAGAGCAAVADALNTASPHSPPLRFFYLTRVAELEAEHSLGVAGRRRVGRGLRRSIAAAAGGGRLGRGGLVARRGCLTRRSLPRLPSLRRLLVAGLRVQVGRGDVAARFVARVRHGERTKGQGAGDKANATAVRRSKQVSQRKRERSLHWVPTVATVAERGACGRSLLLLEWRTANKQKRRQSAFFQPSVLSILRPHRCSSQLAQPDGMLIFISLLQWCFK